MNPEINFTLLVDNQAQAGLEVEHGFAAYISVGDHRILFDTGAGTALLPNAAKLGIDLSRANKLVLSHGHYDHTGGLADFLACNPQAGLYFGQAVAQSRFSCHPGVPPRQIGIREGDYRAMLDLPMHRVHELHAPITLARGIGITGPIPRSCAFEDTGGPFFLNSCKQQVDSIGDDQALWLETRQGLVIVLGCCHAGLVNTVEYIQQLTGVARVSGIVGGLHLLNASQARLERTLAALQSWAPDFLIPCHCTGEVATEFLLQNMGGDIVLPAQAGMTIALGELR